MRFYFLNTSRWENWALLLINFLLSRPGKEKMKPVFTTGGIVISGNENEWVQLDGDLAEKISVTIKPPSHSLHLIYPE